MGILPKLVNRIALAAALAALAACTSPPDQRGNLPEPDKLSQIKPGSTDKATVTQLLGSPSSIAAFDSNTWYYISQTTRPVAFLEPVTLDQQVLAIDFDENGVVVDLRHRAMEDRETVLPNPNASPAPGREFSILEQLIGNFGKFDASEKKAKTAPGGGGN